MFKFKIKMLPIYFVDYCTNLNEIHNYNTGQKAERDYHHLIVKMEKRLNYEYLRIWVLPNGRHLKRHNPERHNSERTLFPNGNHPEWTQSPNEHMQYQIHTIPNALYLEWTQSRMDTISIGHYLE